MFDSGGDGWDDIDFFIEDWTGDFDWDTNLPNGPHGTDGFALGDGTICGNPGCAPGTTPMQLIITGGTQPAQVSWNVTLNGTVLLTGGAPFNDTLCLDTACYQIHLFDAANNGWNGANYTLKYFGGPTLYTGTLASGGLDSALWVMWGADCTTQPGGGQGGGGGGGGGGGSPCGNTGLPTGDCATVVCACDPFTFPITPSGFGNFDEVLGPGSISNPAFGGCPRPLGRNGLRVPLRWRTEQQLDADGRPATWASASGLVANRSVTTTGPCGPIPVVAPATGSSTMHCRLRAAYGTRYPMAERALPAPYRRAATPATTLRSYLCSPVSSTSSHEQLELREHQCDAGLLRYGHRAVRLRSADELVSSQGVRGTRWCCGGTRRAN
ncbi:MAG: hypothetical protein IPN38_11590 [Flavobacteriales bacterium]|nr:hypothetical protein [Flavobacteriales bacterium]